MKKNAQVSWTYAIAKRVWFQELSAEYDLKVTATKKYSDYIPRDINQMDKIVAETFQITRSKILAFLFVARFFATSIFKVNFNSLCGFIFVFYRLVTSRNTCTHVFICLLSLKMLLHTPCLRLRWRFDEFCGSSYIFAPVQYDSSSIPIIRILRKMSRNVHVIHMKASLCILP